MKDRIHIIGFGRSGSTITAIFLYNNLLEYQYFGEISKDKLRYFLRSQGKSLDSTKIYLTNVKNFLKNINNRDHEFILVKRHFRSVYSSYKSAKKRSDENINIIKLVIGYVFSVYIAVAVLRCLRFKVTTVRYNNLESELSAYLTCNGVRNVSNTLTRDLPYVNGNRLLKSLKYGEKIIDL